MESILQKERRCFICARTGELDEHHCISGSSNRQNSEAYGLKIYLCRLCHTKLHDNNVMEEQIKQFAQRRWEEEYGDRNDFIAIFGKSWLED